MTSPLRDAFRPTTSLVGPESVAALRLRHLVLLAVCWIVCYLAAAYALDVIVSRIAPAPAPSRLP